jgi:hemerythrin
MKTEVFKWKEEYSVGLSSVDKQHQRFLEIINLLGDCIVEKTYPVKGHQIFFALMHFADEYLLKEKMLVNSLNELDYSFFREKHNEFLGKLKYFKDNYAENQSEQVFIDLYNYLKRMYPEYLAHYTPTLIKILKENGIN